MRKSKRKALGEDPLGERGMRQNRYLMSKRRFSGEDPYSWIAGKEEEKRMKKKPGPKKLAEPVKRREPFKLKVKEEVKKRKLPTRIRKKLEKIERRAVSVPKEIMAAAKATGKLTSKITGDVSKIIASRIVTAPEKTKRIIRCVQSKIKAGAAKSKMGELFGVLGSECYGLIGKKKAIFKERKIRNLIAKIKDCQKELRKIEKVI